MVKKNYPLLMFLHLPKTAGNTMLDVFAQNYLFKKIVTYYPDLGITPEQWMEKNREAVVQSGVLFGHFFYGLELLLPIRREVIYATMLRDPVKRAISYYHFARKYPDHYLHHEVIKMTLEDFVSSGVCKEINNGQARQLAGYLASQAEKCTEADYFAALAHMKSMAVVGVQERFDDTILLMQKKFGWSSCFFTSKNVGENKGGKVEERVIEKIKEVNQYDLMLYREACERLQNDVEAILDIDDRRSRFKLMNGTIGQLARPYLATCLVAAVRKGL